MIVAHVGILAKEIEEIFKNRTRDWTDKRNPKKLSRGTIKNTGLTIINEWKKCEHVTK